MDQENEYIYNGPLMQSTGSLEKGLVLGKIEGRRRRGQGLLAARGGEGPCEPPALIWARSRCSANGLLFLTTILILVLPTVNRLTNEGTCVRTWEGPGSVEATLVKGDVQTPHLCVVLCAVSVGALPARQPPS